MIKKQEIQNIIDRVVGTKGALHIPAWWMNKILSDITELSIENKGDILDVEKQLNLTEKELTTKIDNVETELKNLINDILVNVTYSELKSLRDNSQLIPGQQYRITDYETITNQVNTKSAGHQFDIIVTADDINVLNENARAIQHDGDTYFSDFFAKTDLSAWELKYCLDNDIDRFAWADFASGKGVIYYMKDEWNNECPYDFKNIQFARWKLSNPVGYRKPNNVWIQESTPFDSLKTGLYGTDSSTKEFYYGGSYYNNYMYKVVYATISESPTYCYTFGGSTDCSKNGSNYGNVIKEYKMGNTIHLNNIVFLGYESFSNTFGYCCHSNTFGSNFNFNNFGHYCHSNSFRDYCYYNSFGSQCNNNSFGNQCSLNSFVYGCSYNILGNYCNYNSLGIECRYNIFGDGCKYNIFGDGCEFNSLGNSCYSNTFGNSCYSNKFGNYCDYNIFGDGCEFNSLGNSCDSNTFGNQCYRNTLGANNNPKSYYRYIIIDSGNQYINLNCTGTTSSTNYYQNVRIGLGVNNTTIYKTINDSNVGQTYETLYRPAKSQTITI